MNEIVAESPPQMHSISTCSQCMYMQHYMHIYTCMYTYTCVYRSMYKGRKFHGQPAACRSLLTKSKGPAAPDRAAAPSKRRTKTDSAKTPAPKAKKAKK